jgi:hypothetical protein
MLYRGGKLDRGEPTGFKERAICILAGRALISTRLHASGAVQRRAPSLAQPRNSEDRSQASRLKIDRPDRNRSPRPCADSPGIRTFQCMACFLRNSRGPTWRYRVHRYFIGGFSFLLGASAPAFGSTWFTPPSAPRPQPGLLFCLEGRRARHSMRMPTAASVSPPSTHWWGRARRSEGAPAPRRR